MNYDFLTEAETRKTDFLADLKELISCRSLLDEGNVSDNAPFGPAMRKTLDFVLKKAAADGFVTHDVDGYAGIIEYGEGEEIIGVLGHLDVVPVGEGWTFDPFEMTEKDGYIFGRGVSDDKGPTMAAYYALKILRDLEIPLQKKIYLIVGCDEETGMRCMQYYKQHAPLPNRGFVPDASFPVIYGEKGILNLLIECVGTTVVREMNLGERPNIVIGRATAMLSAPLDNEAFLAYLSANRLQGSCKEGAGGCEYEIIGEFAHAATPENGVNAGWHMLNFIGNSYNDELCHKLAYLLADFYGKNVGIEVEDEHMGPLTMNLGMINLNSTGGSFVLDIRYPSNTDAEAIVSLIGQAFSKQKLEIKLELATDKSPLFIDPQNELIKTLEACYRQYSGDNETPLQTMGGGTYARTLDNFAAFGAAFPTHPRPDHVGSAHQADEGVAIADLIMATAIYADALYRLTR